MKLGDRIALVTGGGSGIGRAIALTFAEEGARVVVNDVRAAAAKETLEAMGPRQAQGRAIQADVSDSRQVRAMFAELERELGTLDILVNNAGIAETTPGERERLSAKSEARMKELTSGQGIQTHWDVTQEMTDEAWTRMLMSRRNRGSIVNLSSVAAWGLETVPHYSAAKGGILAFTRAVAREVGSRGIRVNAICPGYIDTPMTAPMAPFVRAAVVARTPLRRIGEAREVAQTALFLASDDSAFFTGQW